MTKQPNAITKPRPNIAALSDILKKYVPVGYETQTNTPITSETKFSLVNESVLVGGNKTIKPGHDHDVDELIAAIALAWPEINDLAKEFAALAGMHQQLLVLVNEMFYRVMKRRPTDAEDLLTAIATECSFLRKCEDVMRHIVNDVPEDKAKATAEKFIKEWDTRGSAIV